MNRDDVLRMAKECGSIAKDGFANVMEGDYVIERFAAAMYAAGAEAMRERAKDACNERARGLLSIIGLPVCQSAIVQRDRANQWTEAEMLIRAIPITPTNTEGEQG